MSLVYSFFILLLQGTFYLLGVINKKMYQGFKGRKHQIITKPNTQKPTLWMHCASVGEFEQGLPLLQKMQENYLIVVTFFSPSGYNACAKNKFVHAAYYLPWDSNKNAIDFIVKINPQKVIFVKYELWYNYLQVLKAKRIPTYLISAFYPKNAIYFRPLIRVYYKKMFACFTQIFVQDANSKNMLHQIGIRNVMVAGDTRLDRVLAIAEENFSDQKIEKFISNKKLLVAGSVWLADCNMLKQFMNDLAHDWQLIIVPHEVDDNNVHAMQKTFLHADLYSEQTEATANVLIVNKMGMLSKLYRYATVCYIGGGFGAGIHNTLEAVVYKKPLLFGPNYKRFNEAIFFVENRIAHIVNADTNWVDLMLELENTQLATAQKIENYLHSNGRATDKILSELNVATP
jgi:3-deoxy-D-manno-octulosonic-acid transferase